MPFSFALATGSHYEPVMSTTPTYLTDLALSHSSRILGFKAVDPAQETRLRDIGFAEGDRVEPLHYGLFGRNPMSVRLNGAIIALRRRDAQAILVEAVKS
jgi:ferrous iron transport protein A